MPALPSPGRVVKAVAQYHAEDAIAQNIFYFQYGGTGAPSVSDLSNLHGHLQADLAAPYVGSATTNCVGDHITYTDLQTTSGAVDVETWTWTGTNSTTDGLPANCAVCVSHEISRRYRGGHPRTYMMVGNAGDFQTGSYKMWQASFLTNIQNGWNTYQALWPYNAPFATWTPVNVSFYETTIVGGVKTKTVRATPLVDLITGSTARDRVCSQRRRLGKIGG